MESGIRKIRKRKGARPCARIKKSEQYKKIQDLFIKSPDPPVMPGIRDTGIKSQGKLTIKGTTFSIFK